MTPEILLIVVGLLILVLLLRRPEWWRTLARTLRAAPIELAWGVALVAAVVALLLDGLVSFGVVLTLGLAIVLLAGSDIVRDYVVGVVMRASGRLRLGDVVVIDHHEGVVAEIGRLNVMVDDARGRLIVPNTTIVRGIVHRRSQRVGPQPHRFEVEWDDDTSHADVARTITRAGLLHPRAAAGRDVEVEPLGPRSVAVTVYVVASAHGYDVERAVRAAVDN